MVAQPTILDTIKLIGNLAEKLRKLEHAALAEWGENYWELYPFHQSNLAFQMRRVTQDIKFLRELCSLSFSLN